jgi:hypothetical protein
MPPPYPILAVTPGRVPGIHVVWPTARPLMAGTRPAMTLQENFNS